ncbi:hypothetical protein B6A42_02335 [Vibrio coralliilyticus]|nr:hypothetical protein B6A42_02335 [Vibrio coralliilyticus]NOI32328.1 helix-turn-helix domain-containing protein [Vibrio coralliilyticus]NOI51439.1 helix-turn-helix domain-containing protein [Vibrio coralliilyticus]PAU36528.1 XRE family transcriptional regulator [Vibrio coralliilyticus]
MNRRQRRHEVRLNRPHPMTALLLKHCRKESGLKQADFIKKHKIPVTQATFSRWEKGKQAVPVEVLLSLGLIAPAVEVN